MKRLLLFAMVLAGNLLAQISVPTNLRIVTGEPTPSPSPSSGQDIDLRGYKLVFEENFDVLSIADTDAKGDKRWYFHPHLVRLERSQVLIGPPGRCNVSMACSLTRPPGMRIGATLSEKNWETGCLASMDKTRSGFAQRYGYWSARVTMPDAGWSALARLLARFG